MLRMLSNERLVMGCVEGCLLYSRVHRGGLCRQFVVMWSVFCVDEIFVCIGSPSSSYVNFYVMTLIVGACFLLSRIRVYFVGCACVHARANFVLLLM